METEEAPRLYLARFEGLPGNVSTQDEGDLEILWQGEILISLLDESETGLQFDAFNRVALRSSSVESLDGMLSLAGPQERDRSDHQFDMRGYYPYLGSLKPACVESDAVFPLFEHFIGEIFFERIDGGEADELWFRIQLDQEVVPRSEIISPLEKISFGPAEIPFYPLPDQYLEESKHNSLGDCTGTAPIGTGHVHKNLKIRFVSLLNPQPSAGQLESWLQDPVSGASLEGACRVWWQKGGIKIDPKSTIDFETFSNGDITQLEETQLPNNIAQDPDRIDVYLVDQLLDKSGGGVTHGCGTNNAYIILEIEEARNNRYLLAHEIGHVLGLFHPGESAACSEFLEGSFCSVMVPGTPNSSRNTANNLGVTEIASYPLTPPVFETLSTGDWEEDPEQGFHHLIRDFPYDDGSEPSVLEHPFKNRWSASDVWNSNLGPLPGENPDRKYSNGTLIFDLTKEPHYAPVHHEPSESGPNHMLVQLHGCDEDVTPPVEVYFYLGVPGSSSEHLRLLNGSFGPHILFNSFEMDSSGNPYSTLPGPGKPIIKSISWSVPVGLPPHSCVFAIAKSANDLPETDPDETDIENIIAAPLNYNFYDLQAFVQSDNDVAQRNLHITSTTSSSSSASSTMLAWVEMSIDSEGVEAANIEVDGTFAQELLGLALEINDREFGEIALNEPYKISILEILRDQKRALIRLRATLPAGLPVGATIPIDLNFKVNGELLNGFRHVIRIAPLSETVSQVLDRLLGALRNVAFAFEADIARDLSEEVRKIVIIERHAKDQSGCWGVIQRILSPTSVSWRIELRKLSRRFAALARDLEVRVDADPDRQRVSKLLFELAGRLNTSPRSTTPNLQIEQIRELADRIQEPACRIARAKENI